MKLFGFFAIALAATTALACEPACQEGIIGDFMNKYSPVIQQDFAKFGSSANLFAGVSANNTKFQDDVRKAFKSECAKVAKKFVTDATPVVLNAIFGKTAFEPFRGDCNHPFRVKQPPKGVPWTMEDCNKMDYRCGNPPSICHFFDIVKKRNYDTIAGLLANSTSYTKELSNALTKAIKKAGSKYSSTVPTIKKNVKKAYTQFTTTFKGEFCAGAQATVCDSCDPELKTKFLSYP